MSDFWGSLTGETSTSREVAAFAQAEIIIPNGPYHDQYYSVGTQPFIKYYFDAIASRQYQRFAVVGPTQSGKTLSCSVIPTLWHLFECCDDVVYGAPTIEIAKDKWKKDFAPVIKRMRYASYMPVHGTGARGGTPTGIDFLNGASLRFMTGGGSDKTVAGYTARAITITEVDGMDQAGVKSREADRISQLEVRGDAFGIAKRVYLECTASIEEGRIWQEYLNGTHVVLVKQCPYCQEWVCPEREHIQGWQDKTEKQALREAFFVCPACAHPLTPRDRVDMVHGCKEQMSNPDSLTYSIRYNAFDNLFWTAGEIGLDEWRAAHKPEHQKEDAIKVQHQFKWALPYKRPEEDEDEKVINLDGHLVQTYRRGVVPPWAKFLTVGVDVHAKVLYWTLVAWAEDATCHVVDYGRIETPYKDFGQEKAVKLGLEHGKKVFEPPASWPVEGSSTAKRIDGGLIDAGWLPEIVRSVASPPFYPAVGLGTSNNFRRLKRGYNAPKKKSAEVRSIGEAWHLTRRKAEKTGHYYRVVEHDVDYGKSWVQRRWAAPEGVPGKMTIFHTDEIGGHEKFEQHLKSEEQIIEKGVPVWRIRKFKEGEEKESVQNHWLDSTVLAATVARMLGVTVIETEKKK